MDKKWTLTDIQQLIADAIEEDRNLEYKGAEALGKSDGKKNEISKDVSSLANSNGGIIIYGIKEFDDRAKCHLPEKIDPINRVDFSKEWLEQIINNKIQPKIKGIAIDPVVVSEADNTVVYVVKVPKGHTAHQASGHKYYKRYNFEAVPMEDYEVRDVMNRTTHPEIILDFEIERATIEVETTPNPMIGLTGGKTFETRTYNTLKIFVRNIGSVFANYVNFYIEVNKNFLSPDELNKVKLYSKDSSGRVYAEYYGENTVRDIVGGKTLMGTYYPEYGPSRFDPILPGMHSRSEKISLQADISSFNQEIITWKVYADNALPKTGEIKIADIPITETEE